ncbi:MAG: hypothetical protein A2Z34_07365 [Planctomycetes bacterium RBG_16_59_8]|nr:MAG: hypothetical protein A2Z34_07365 [Planctomycetes bacterium RBG_16_59_8]
MGLLFLLAFGVRFYLFATQECISKDGPVYIDVAQRFHEGDFRGALAVGYQPLYPFLTSLLYPLLGDWIAAAQLVSILFSALTVLPLFFLVRELFGGHPAWRSVALVTLFLFIFIPLPTRLSSQALTTGSATFFLLTSVWLSVRAIATERWSAFAWATFAILCGYLVRPDILLLFPLLAGWVVWWSLRDFRNRRRKMCVALSTMVALFLLLAAPYIIHSMASKGIAESLTSKVNIVIQKEEGEGGSAVGEFVGSLASTFFYWPLLFLLFGLIRRKELSARDPREWFVVAALVLLLLLMFGLEVTRGYLSKRHMVPAVVLMLPWVAVGMVEAVGCLRHPRWLTVAVVVGLLSFLPKTFDPLERDKQGEREVGEWVRTNLACREEEALTTAVRPWFYAFGNVRCVAEHTVYLRKRAKELSDYDSLAPYMAGKGVRYLIVDGSIEDSQPGLDPKFFEKLRADPRWRPLFETYKDPRKKKESSRIAVYEFIGEGR